MEPEVAQKSPGPVGLPIVILAAFAAVSSILIERSPDSIPSLFKIPEKITTPLNLAALVVVVLYAIYTIMLRSGGKAQALARQIISDRIATYLFVLALVTIVLVLTRQSGSTSPSPVSQSTRLYGKVHSPPSDTTQGVPNASVFIDVGQTYPIIADGSGEFSFEIPSNLRGHSAKIWAKAERFQHSDVQSVTLDESQKVYIPLRPTTRTDSGRKVGGSSPSANVFPAKCLDGDWKEEPTGTALWNFELHSDTLSVHRNDGKVSGTLRRVGDDWKGNLIWANGENWSNVIYTATRTCDQVTTNQSWWFSRPTKN